MSRVGIVTEDGVTIRLRAPAAHLAELVIDYAFYDSGPAGSRVRHNEYMPGPANVAVTFDAGPVAASMRSHRFEWTDDAVVFGPTSHAFRARSDGGRMIGFGVTALGWSRLFGKHADAAADRVVPLARLWSEPRARVFYAALVRAGTDEDAAAAVLDRYLTAALLPPTRDTAMVEALTRIVQDPAVEDCGDAAARIGVPETQLRRIGKQYFGFGPKLLLRRHRFMRAIAALTASAGDDRDAATIFTLYYDQSHFIRDARLFLGRTARQFGNGMTPVMAGLLQGRTISFGAPVQSLIAAGRDNLVDPASDMATPLDAASPSH